MPLPANFDATMYVTVLALPELTTFRAAVVSLLHATTPATRLAAWRAIYERGPDHADSLYQQLSKAIRAAVALQTVNEAGVTALDREAAYRDLATIFAPKLRKPTTEAEQAAELQELLLLDQLD